MGNSKSNPQHYDFIIIGAGLAGIYTAYRLYIQFPDASILILEKDNRIGGRVLQQEFHGRQIQWGAGILRPSNHHMFKLLKKLQMEIKEFKHDMEILNINMEQKDLNDMLTQIQSKFDNAKIREETKKQGLTFQQFIYKHFDRQQACTFLNCCEYSDFWNSDVQKTLDTYPKDELLTKKSQQIFSIVNGNKGLIDKLISLIPEVIFKIDFKVDRIYCRQHDVIVQGPKTYSCSRLFVCADASIKNVDFIGVDVSFLKYIQEVPFYRSYIFHNNLNFKSTKDSESINDKQIAISQNITMNAYCDGIKAQRLQSLTQGREKDIEYIRKIFGQYYIQDFRSHYWPIGIHMYLPHPQLDKIYTPNRFSRVIFLGEMVSDRQGWMEGAVKSVDDYFDKLKNSSNSI